MNNRDIDNFVLQGDLEIDYGFALSELAYYSQELTMLRAGAKYSDLGISKRRHANRPGIVNAKGYITQDSTMLTNQSKTPGNSFAYIKLEGVLRSRDGASTPGIHSVTDALHAARENKNILGVLIEANTGGGENLAGQILKSALEDFNKPVVTYVHFLASAGYFGVLPSNEIIASGAMAQIGSLGSYIRINKSFRGWYKANFQDLYADKSSNKNREFRAFMDGDIEPMVKRLNEANDSLLRSVRKFRPLKGNIKHTLSGELFYAKDAKTRGLIDHIGPLQFALKRLAILAKEQDSPRKRAIIAGSPSASSKLEKKPISKIEDVKPWMRNPINQRALRSIKKIADFKGKSIL